MASFLRQLFERFFPPPLELDHEVFGRMRYVSDFEYWETRDAEVFSAIPGDEAGPDPGAVQFVRDKQKDLDTYWSTCSAHLLEIAHNWDSIDRSLQAKALFKVAGVSVTSVEPPVWEITFETRPESKWIHVGLHFEGDEVVANDITT